MPRGAPEARAGGFALGHPEERHVALPSRRGVLRVEDADIRLQLVTVSDQFIALGDQAGKGVGAINGGGHGA